MTQETPVQAIQELLDKQEIVEALSRYSRGCDLIDADLIRSVFLPDAIADYGPRFWGTGYEFAEMIERVHPGFESHAHHIDTVTITVGEGTAGSEAYAAARLRKRSVDGTATDYIVEGRYLDRWKRHGGVWRIAHRRFLLTMDESRVVEGSASPGEAPRDASDPSYEILRRSWN